MNPFELLDLTNTNISLNRYTELVKKEKAYEKIREYLKSRKPKEFLEREILFLLADLNTEKESSEDGR